MAAERLGHFKVLLQHGQRLQREVATEPDFLLSCSNLPMSREKVNWA
jgi:hypothetical protein